MQTYRIVSFVDGNGNTLYRIQYKWLFGIWLYYTSYDGYDRNIYETYDVNQVSDKYRWLVYNEKQKQRKYAGIVKDDKSNPD